MYYFNFAHAELPVSVDVRYEDQGQSLAQVRTLTTWSILSIFDMQNPKHL